MDIQIRDLQEKAFNGDESALELYNEYVNKGQAPRISVNNTANSFNMAEAYKALVGDKEAAQRPSLFGSGERMEATDKTPFELMASGYAALNTKDKGVEK